MRSSRLFVNDTRSRLSFLSDTGTDVSVYPRSFAKRRVKKGSSQLDALRIAQRRANQPTTTRLHQNGNAFNFKDFKKTPYVFMRHDAPRTSLQPPYDGPFEVIKRYEKTYKIKCNGRVINVSIDRVKPAYVLDDTLSNDNPRRGNSDEPEELTQTPKPITVLSDRPRKKVRFPDRLQAGFN